MAAPTPPQMERIDRAHYRRIEEFARKVELEYRKAIQQLAQQAAGKQLKQGEKYIFRFEDYPELKTQLDNVLKQLATRVTATIRQGNREEWMLAVKKNDDLAKRILQSSELTPERLEGYFQRNTDALEAFQSRKLGAHGMNLSQRVWKYVQGFKGEMELALDIGLGEGKSAAQLSRDVRSYLKEPDKLFRRVRDKHGNLVLSQRAKEYKPGRGVYRSSYKNAMRLTRSEINMAYRQSDMERIKQFDFIVGYEVKLSKSRPPDFYDICDELKGKYPKVFNFKGWHTQCLCHVITITLTPDEINEREKLRFAGKDPNQVKSVNEVKNMPKGFRDWVNRNQERAQGWKSQPYFIKDNFKGGSIQGGLKTGLPMFALSPLAQTEAPPALLKPTDTKTVTPVPQEFMPAKSLKEAQQWAIDNLKVKYADFGKLHLSVANDINRVMYSIKKLMPEITTAGLGSAQSANRAMKADIIAAYRQGPTYKALAENPRLGIQYAEKRAKSFASSIVGNVGVNTVAWSTNRESTSITGGQRIDLSKYRGVYFNEKYAMDPAKINKVVTDMEKMGFYTKAAKGAGYIMSHEVGHELDKTLNFRISQEFKNIYAKHTRLGTNYVTTNLSKYGATANGKASHKPTEFIAEAWAEYVTSPTPRPIAVEIGDAMLKEYYLKYVQGEPGVKFNNWKLEIQKILKR